MDRISKLHIKGLRRLSDLRLEMRPLMVLVGANGIGKTSLLDAISLLSASASGTLNKTLSDLGGIAELTSKGQAVNNISNISFDVEMDCSGYEPLIYHLEVEARGQGYRISQERLSQKRKGGDGEPFKHIESDLNDIRYFDINDGKLLRPEWEHNPQESSLSQVPKMFRQPEDLRRILSSVTRYHVLDVGARAPVKLPQQMKPAVFPGADGEDLVPYLYNLRESDRDLYEVIEDTLRAGFSGFEHLFFPPAAAGMLSMTWKDKHFREPVYAHQLSEGMLRFIWLISLLQSSALSTITMLDEPEVSLHPELLCLLVELLREASGKSQIIVATHSDSLIRFLEPKEVVVMDIDEDGYASANWADNLDIEQWLADYTLDEVWRMGQMGGRS